MGTNPEQTPFYQLRDNSTTGDMCNYEARLQDALLLIDGPEKVCRRDKDLSTDSYAARGKEGQLSEAGVL
jgi:hypothetical protein